MLTKFHVNLAKTSSLLFIILLSFSSNGQSNPKRELKSYDGPIVDLRNVGGSINFTEPIAKFNYYFTDDQQMVITGKITLKREINDVYIVRNFSATRKKVEFLTGEIEDFIIEDPRRIDLNQAIKKGTWSYQFTVYGDKTIMGRNTKVVDDNTNLIEKKTIMICGYKANVLDGDYTYKQSFFQPGKETVLYFNRTRYNNGTQVGEYILEENKNPENSQGRSIKVRGKFDNNGFYVGEWRFDDFSNGIQKKRTYANKGILIKDIEVDLNTGARLRFFESPMIKYLKTNELSETMYLDTVTFVDVKFISKYNYLIDGRLLHLYQYYDVFSSYSKTTGITEGVKVEIEDNNGNITKLSDGC